MLGPIIVPIQLLRYVSFTRRKCMFLINFETIPLVTQVHSLQTHRRFPSRLSPAPLRGENYAAHSLQPFPSTDKNILKRTNCNHSILTCCLGFASVRSPYFTRYVSAKFRYIKGIQKLKHSHRKRLLSCLLWNQNKRFDPCEKYAQKKQKGVFFLSVEWGCIHGVCTAGCTVMLGYCTGQWPVSMPPTPCSSRPYKHQ